MTARFDPSIGCTMADEYLRLRALWATVLQGAISDFKAGPGKRSSRNPHYSGARAWLMSERVDYTFAFRNLCEVLDLDPDQVRRRIGLA